MTSRLFTSLLWLSLLIMASVVVLVVAIQSPLATRKIWLFPFGMSLLLMAAGNFSLRLLALPFNKLSASILVIASLILQLNITYFGRIEQQSRIVAMSPEAAMAQALQRQVQQGSAPEGLEFQNPYQTTLTDYLRSRYAALGFSNSWLYPWWIFEIISTSALAFFLISRFLPASSVTSLPPRINP